MVVEDIEEKPVLLSRFKEDDGEEMDEEEDDYSKDPDWRETPRIRRSKEVFNKSKVQLFSRVAQLHLNPTVFISFKLRKQQLDLEWIRVLRVFDVKE